MVTTQLELREQTVLSVFREGRIYTVNDIYNRLRTAKKAMDSVSVAQALNKLRQARVIRSQTPQHGKPIYWVVK